MSGIGECFPFKIAAPSVPGAISLGGRLARESREEFVLRESSAFQANRAAFLRQAPSTTGSQKNILM
jgi:hypothetical protein